MGFQWKYQQTNLINNMKCHIMTQGLSVLGVTLATFYGHGHQVY